MTKDAGGDSTAETTAEAACNAELGNEMKQAAKAIRRSPSRWRDYFWSIPAYYTNLIGIMMLFFLSFRGVIDAQATNHAERIAAQRNWLGIFFDVVDTNSLIIFRFSITLGNAPPICYSVVYLLFISNKCLRRLTCNNRCTRGNFINHEVSSRIIKQLVTALPCSRSLTPPQLEQSKYPSLGWHLKWSLLHNNWFLQLLGKLLLGIQLSMFILVFSAMDSSLEMNGTMFMALFDQSLILSTVVAIAGPRKVDKNFIRIFSDDHRLAKLRLTSDARFISWCCNRINFPVSGEGIRGLLRSASFHFFVTGGKDTSELEDLVGKEGAVLLAAALKKHEVLMSQSAAKPRAVGHVGLFMASKTVV
jgi:hypothetical protein